jgi:hypothetical protein
MSTRAKRRRCLVCRKSLPDQYTRDKCAGSCQAQTVLFPKRLAERLSRSSSNTTGGGR